MAPTRPYHSGYEPFNWRGWLDFGTGAIGDMSCHTANLAYRALKLGLPISVVAEAGDVNPQTYPAWAKVTLEFPERHGLPSVKLHWYEGHDHGKKVLPPEKLVKIMDAVRKKHGIKDSGSGSIMVGEKGMLFSPGRLRRPLFLAARRQVRGLQEARRRRCRATAAATTA